MEEMRHKHADGKWEGVSLRWCHFRTGPNQSTSYRVEEEEGPEDYDDMDVDDGDEVDLQMLMSRSGERTQHTVACLYVLNLDGRRLTTHTVIFDSS
jgi:hypothetical protein